MSSSDNNWMDLIMISVLTRGRRGENKAIEEAGTGGTQPEAMAHLEPLETGRDKKGSSL